MKEKKVRKNKVYFAEGDPDYGCIYIAAKTSKEAKNIALCTWVAETVYNPFIEMRVCRVWSVKETDYDGELNIKQINELGITWWDCPKCGKEEFEIIDTHYYKCKNCEYEGEIPYI